MTTRSAVLSVIAILAGCCGCAAADPVPDPVPDRDGGQRAVAAVGRMPRLPIPLAVRAWPRVARDYYRLVLNPDTVLDGHRLVVLEPGKPGFGMPTFVPRNPGDEAVSCLPAVIGAKLAGLDPRDHHGVDWVRALDAWFDAGTGVYRSKRFQRTLVLHAGIYGYWPAIMGMVLASQYPDDPELQMRLRGTVAAFETISRGVGCPGDPDFDVLGFNFETGKPDGRNEPMNRLGHAPSVAWPLVAGAALDPVRAADRIACARAAMQWHIDHPGRYELIHIMGPLAAARLNAEHGCDLDMDALMDIWFGDVERGKGRHRWIITAGAGNDGITLDGLDGARWDERGDAFHAFGMGSLHGPAWLVPVVRYDQRYARAIARYALHLANNARLFQGEGLDWQHQDHKDWKEKWDPENLLFYEALSSWEWSDVRRFRPYATGDPLRLGWGCEKVGREDYLAEKRRFFSKACQNLALYSGNHVGFLGGICELTDVPGILSWDCLKTDWLHGAAYPTRLLFNPHGESKVVTLKFGGPADLHDLVTGRTIAADAGPEHRLSLAADQAVVLVELPVGGKATISGGRMMLDGVTIDYRARSARKLPGGG